jgi:hypothetical protein
LKVKFVEDIPQAWNKRLEETEKKHIGPEIKELKLFRYLDM